MSLRICYGINLFCLLCKYEWVVCFSISFLLAYFNNLIFFCSEKSRIKWHREGDENTKFSHAMVNWHRRRNDIKGLDVDGVWHEEPLRVKQGIHDFFKSKFLQERSM